jgi:hypothetical protein
MPARHPSSILLTALAGLSCLAVAGCAAGGGATIAAHDQQGSHGPSAGVSAGTPAVAIASTVLPAQLGDTWVYAVNSDILGKGTETARISAVKAVPGGQRATMSLRLSLAGSKAPLSLSAEFTEAGDGSITFASASILGARFPATSVNWPSPASLTPGRPRTSTVTESFLGSKTAERVTILEVGRAMVTVPAGSYQATLLQQTATDGKGDTNVIKSWVVNGIGQVKTETTVIVGGKRFASSDQELMSFTRG